MRRTFWTCCFVLQLGTLGCNRIVMTQRGVLPVELPDGTHVYFKREVRGHNYDALWISADADPCRSAEPRTDYIYRAMGPLVVFYSAREAGLTTYSTTTLDKPSDAGSLHVVNYVLQPLAFQELSRTYHERHLLKAAVEVRASWGCS